MFYIEHKTPYLYVDCETTGLKPGTDEVLSISVIDQTGKIAFNSLIRPERRKKWVEAQNINHISPEMVRDAPTYRDVVPQLQRIFRGAHIVTYNLEFDYKFLHEAMCTASSFHCCMKAYAKFQKEIDGVVEGCTANWKLINIVQLLAKFLEREVALETVNSL